MIHAFHGIDHSVAQTARARLRPCVQRHGKLGVQRRLQRQARPARRRRASLQPRSRAASDRAQSAARDLLLVARRRAARRAARPLRRTSRRACAASRATATARSTIPPRRTCASSIRAARSSTIWQRNEGVAYVVAPIGIEYADVLRNREVLDDDRAAVVRCRRCPELRAYTAQIAREQEARASRLRLLGQAGAGVRRPARARHARRPRAGSARQQSHGTPVHR